MGKRKLEGLAERKLEGLAERKRGREEGIGGTMVVDKGKRIGHRM